MAKTAAEGFSLFLSRLTPTDSERTTTASHRQSVYDKLASNYTLYRMFESGSFKHGTGVSGFSDVDYVLSLNQVRPANSYSILASIRETLAERFPTTYIHVSRPAVVVEFGSGAERVEILAAYPDTKANGENMRFMIPGVTDEWIWSTPEAHLAYVNGVNGTAGIYGGAKSLARLAKAWKYHRNVPISSFYLEMRAASYMAGESSISWPYDIKGFLASLLAHELADMNDPTGRTGRISPCSSDAKHADALSKLRTASSRADIALTYYQTGLNEKAFGQWDLLWNGEFPAFY